MYYLSDISICYVSNKENCANLYFAVIVYIPSFIFERIFSLFLDIEEINIDRNASLRSALTKKSYTCFALEANIIRLPGKDPLTLSVVKISNI